MAAATAAAPAATGLIGLGLVGWFSLVVRATVAEDQACWAENYGYSFSVCCPPELDPVGNISCWWDGYEFDGTVCSGEYSYARCCNNTVLARAEVVLGKLMEHAQTMPFLLAPRIVLELDVAKLLPSRFVVNFGAADGTLTGDDPTVPLYRQHGFGGLAVEPDEVKAAMLRQNMPAAVTTRAVGVTPWNAAELLEEAQVPAEPALLKVDIDSFDCAVVLASLRVVRPAVVQVEVNSEVPYPLIFGVHYSPDFRHSSETGRRHGWFSRGFFGCSSALAAEIVQPFGYDVVGQTGAHDLLFMRRDLRLELKARMPWAPILSYTPGGAARALSIRNMKNYFGQGVGVSWLLVAETRLDRLLALVAAGVETSCVASQGSRDRGACARSYTLGWDAEEFRQLY